MSGSQAGREVGTAAHATRLLAAGVVLATCGAFAAVTLSPILVLEITGSRFLSGLPFAAMLAGGGVGATGVAALIRRHGHPLAYAVTYVVGAAGCALAVAATSIGNVWLLIAGVAGIGVGHAANQLARYTAAELQPEERRPAVIGWMVWALAVGAVLGPLAPAPAGRLVEGAGLAVEVGGFVLGAALFVAAAAVHLLGRRAGAPATPPSAAEAAGDVPVVQEGVASLPTVRIAVVTMVVCTAVMLLVMTVTPVHVHTAGHGVGGVGAVMSAHTFGMFALAPIAGSLTARLGAVRVILGGLGTLAAATALAATAPASAQLLLAVALFALGFGWCLGFVAGSALLAQRLAGLAPAARVQLQGRVEALTWVAGALAAVGSGLLLGSVGYAGLNLLAAVVLLAPLAVILRQRRRTPLAEGVAG